VFWGLSVLWSCAIFWVSSQPGSQIPGGWFPEVGHFSEYLVLGGLLYGALGAGKPQRRAILVAVAIASLYGITDEFHQSFVPTRTPDVADWAMDTLGAAFGAAIAHGLAILRARSARSAE
jgi:VanZ family protein